MGRPRLELQALLEEILGSENVYFQPPNNLKMQYPCIRYEQDDGDTDFASNKPYRHTKRYQVTHIDQDPDSPIPDVIVMLPMCLFDRSYTADNLNHKVFNLFF